MPDSYADSLVAAAIAFEAGQLLLSIRMGDQPSIASSPSFADASSNDLIIHRLRERYPNDAILSEETTDGPERLARDRVWIVDPLDGSREFGESPRDDWAVHVALLQEDIISAAAVALPAKGMLFSTISRFPHTPKPGGDILLAVSRTRPAVEASRLREALPATLVPMGSAGVKAMAVVRGEVDGYIHSGGQYEWDSAAPVAVARANGLHASRIDGSPFQWNQETPWQPDLLICRPEYARLILDVLSR